MATELDYGSHTGLESLKKICSFSDAFVHDILTLLDRIDVEEDHTLAIQRHAIAEKHGMEVVIGEPISGMMN